MTFEVEDLEIMEVNNLGVDDSILGGLQNTNTLELETPINEMLFETSEDAKNYYIDYGRKNGFMIRTRTSSENNVLFVCVNEGKHISRAKKINVEMENDMGEQVKAKQRTRNCSTIRCGCDARLRINYVSLKGKWKVTDFNDGHNHFLVSPSKRMKMRSNKKMPECVKSLTEVFHRENLKVCKISSVIGGEHIGFDDRDCYNHLRNVRHRDLEGGDARYVLNYFENKQAQNPQFYYAVQWDENDRATNFFWVDSHSRMAYHYFGDVVSFDTTYRTNKYDMPFAPFTGVNHHWQSIQFGCALLQDETEVTFCWLFEVWLKAMGGRPPVAILTDQDLAMKAAIAKVFPNTRHRLCYWHIKKKFAEKLAHVYHKNSKFKKDVKNCFWYTYRKEEFEERWISLMKEYGLESNEWLQQMYKIREMWIPAYNRDIFFAGMNTTGRSEGVNSFFNEFVTKSTTLREFVLKYEQALKKIIKRENDEDFESEHKYRIVNDNEFLLGHAAKVYTRNVFNKFKDEMTGVFSYRIEEETKANELQSFVVASRNFKSQKFLVTMDLETKKGKCECQNFEFVGILCRHILKVFVRLDIEVIPDHFILPRWRQKANKFRRVESISLEYDNGKEESEALRLAHMCQESTKLACLASPSHEGYKIYMEAMNDISEKLEKLVKVSDHPPPSVKEKNNLDSIGSSQILLLDPNISQTKGKRKGTDERLKSGIETSKPKRNCKGCQKLVRHDWRTCPLNPMSKANKVLEAEAAEAAQE